MKENVRVCFFSEHSVVYTPCPRGATLVFVITFTVLKLFWKFLKLATSHIFLQLLMYSNCPPHLNYATTLPCKNYNNKIGQF